MQVPDMISGILLAAGDSTRMGSPKALLQYKNATFIDTILNNLQEAGCSPIISILGRSAELICEQTNVHQFQCYRNPDPSRGMLSSLKIAIGKLPSRSDGFIMALVDHPAVKAETYELLFRKASSKPDRIIIPEYQGHRGHPVYFGKEFFSALLQTADELGARKVIDNYFKQVEYLPVEDSGIMVDIDTFEDFQSNIH
jgi:molybdenum cofactor cytidylyltransferase